MGRAPGAGEKRADEVLVSRTITLLHRHDRGVVKSMREIGDAIFRDYFAGDVGLVVSNDPFKAKRFARLGVRADRETEPSGTFGGQCGSAIARLENLTDILYTHTQPK